MNTLAAIARIATTRKSNEVVEVACRDRGNELSVTETGMSFDCPPPLTVILPEPPMSPAKNDAVRPSDATSTRPTDVVQVKLGTDTVFPYASTAVTVRVIPAPVATLIEFVETTRWSKAAGVTVTVMNAARPETVAVTRTGPACCGAVRMPDEIPIEPADATQVAVDPAIEFPFASVTTAVKARVPVTPTLDWGALITTAAGGPARIATVIVAVGTPETPTAVIEMLTSGPVAVGAVYRNSRSSDDSRDNEPPPAVQVRCRVVTSLPWASNTLAASVVVVPAIIDRLDWSTVTREAAPGTTAMATVVCGALPALATTVPLPTRFDALSTPPAEIVPMPPVTVHATVRPEIALPNASLGVPLKASVPPATTVPVPVPVVVAAVNKPEASIVPMPPVTVHVKFAPGIVFPKRSFAAAPKAIVAPAQTLATPGDRST